MVMHRLGLAACVFACCVFAAAEEGRLSAGCVSVPAGARWGRLLSVPVGADWSGWDGVCFRARLDRRFSGDVWLHARLKGTFGWEYTATNVVHLRSSRWRKVVVPFDRRWFAAGHFRPFDRLTLEDVESFALEFSTERPDTSLSVQVRDVHLYRWGRRGENLHPCGFEVKDAVVGMVCRVCFELVPVEDAPASTAVFIPVEVIYPSGAHRRLYAFYTQDFVEEWGRPVPSGPGHWEVRFLATESGAYRVRLGPSALLATESSVKVEVKESGERPVRALVSTGKYLVNKLDVWYPIAWERTAKGWRKHAGGAADLVPAWYFPVQRGRYGYDLFDLEEAWRVDRVLQLCGMKHAYPLALLVNEELSYASANAAFPYRWEGNPLSSCVRAPEDVFTDGKAASRLAAYVKYVAARWGEYPAVKGFMFASQLCTGGERRWIRDVADTVLSKAGKPVYALSPLLDPRVESSRKVFVGEGKGFLDVARSLGDDEREVRFMAVGMLLRMAVPGGVSSLARVVVGLEDDEGWWYQYEPPQFLRPGRENDVFVPLGKDAYLKPLGHGRPWCDYVRARLSRVHVAAYEDGKRVSVEIPFTLTLFVSTRSSVPSTLDISLEKKNLRAGEMLQIRCGTPVGMARPFDPDYVDVRAVIVSPRGRKIVRPAFLYQSYREAEAGGRPVPVGAPCWMVRYVPPVEGVYAVRLEADVRGIGRLASRGERFTVEGRYEPPAAPAAGKASIGKGFVLGGHGLCYRGFWSRWTGKKWVRESSVGRVPSMWFIPLRWTSRWGGYHDLGGYNLAVAWEADRVMELSSLAGIRRPLRLNGNQEFFENGKYHWSDNPLNAANGGPLSSPSAYFADAAAEKQERALFRYLVARWGAYRSVESFVLAADVSFPGARGWHRRMGRYLGRLLDGRPLFSLHPEAADFFREKPLAESVGALGWKVDDGIVRRGKVEVRSSPDGRSVVFRWSRPGENAVVCNLDGEWSGYDLLSFDVEAPAELPPNARLMVYLRDPDLWWYQAVPAMRLVPGGKVRFFVDLRPGHDLVPPPPSGGNDPWVHTKPWTLKDLCRVRALGFRIFGAGKSGGFLKISNCRLINAFPASDGPLKVVSIDVSLRRVPVYGLFEVSFRLNRQFSNPFDPKQVDLWAVIDTPGGRGVRVPAFYFQDYRRMKIERYCPLHHRRELFEHLVPRGAPLWKVRFTPTQVGGYRFRIVAGGKTLWPREGWGSFEAVPSERKGFVRVAQGDRFFEFSSGGFFFPIGMNLRSPGDVRNTRAYDFMQRWHEGTFLYDDYFRRLAEAGCNWARVWMCPWWLALEWNRNWPGYHGLGRYNLENAWRMDHLLHRAEECGIYLQIDTTNHGQLSLKVDTEWKSNPFNEANGGFLHRPREFFADPRAWELYADRVRYTLARWGYSTHVFSWGLLTEVEFVDDYFAVAYPKGEKGRSPLLASWHRMAAALFRKLDPYHMISTHFSHPWRGADVWSVKGLSYVESNAYWQNWKFRKHPRDTVWILRRCIRRGDGYLSRFGRPVLIGEYGGGVFRNGPSLLDAQLHAGLWAMVASGYAGATGFWWWPYVHYRDKYRLFTPVVRFMRGEDRRRWGRVRLLDVTLEGDSDDLGAVGAGDGRHADVWVFHRRVQYNLARIPVMSGVSLVVRGMVPGRYRAEVWDALEGKVIEDVALDCRGKVLRLSLPKVRADVALKVRPIGKGGDDGS